MTLDPTAASSYIQWYKAILLEIESTGTRFEHHNVLSVLGAARARLVENPALLDDAVERLRAKAEPVDERVVSAVRTLSVQDWVFLRDTTRYSLFLNASGFDAYAVVGLTEPIRKFSQGSGVFIKTGVVEFAGRFVCDGLVTRIVQLGGGIRRSFANAYCEAKAAGRFHLRPVA